MNTWTAQWAHVRGGGVEQGRKEPVEDWVSMEWVTTWNKPQACLSVRRKRKASSHTLIPHLTKDCPHRGSIPRLTGWVMSWSTGSHTVASKEKIPGPEVRGTQSWPAWEEPLHVTPV